MTTHQHIGPGQSSSSEQGQFQPARENGAVRLKMVVRGAVQGVGFRPFVFRLAKHLQLTGWVNNSALGVFIEVEGTRSQLEEFQLQLASQKPPHSFIQSLESSWLDAVGYARFEIRPSDQLAAVSALVMPDIATCPDCLREILDPANRRFRYPFTNCTHCGPRFSIIQALPYDRATTSMRAFTMCQACQAEYDAPGNRRFHTQPNACPVCGPRLELWSPEGEVIFGSDRALRAAAQMLRRGRILAVKGIGGFHLMVDARNEPAVELLRTRKHREEKPFAVMFPTISTVRQECEMNSLEERLLRSPEAPIVLVKKNNRRASAIAAAVAPDNPNLGVLLPSNPLHHLLLLDLGFPVVATSGNFSDEPICTDEHDALKRLGGIADAFLVHDRPIVRHVDDSIVALTAGREMVLRRARGYAPLPIHLAAARDTRRSDNQYLNGDELEPTQIVRHKTILAVGAQLKNTVALLVGENVFISQHIGDLETEAANHAFRQVVADLPALYRVQPEFIATDLHPDYLSTRYAQELSRKGSVELGGDVAFGGHPGQGKTGDEASPTPSATEASQLRRVSSKAIGVQHHIAHVLSCLAENEVQLPALGVAWDGTGYGTDGTIWGGEFFRITENKVERVAHLRPFRLPGGDKAIKEPRRAAVGLLYELYGEAAFEMSHLAALRETPPVEMITLKGMLQRRFNCPLTSSVGRLFDVVASLINLRHRMQFEGQAAMELEFAIGDLEVPDRYHLPLMRQQQTLVLDWSRMIPAIMMDANNGVAAGMISAKFHNALAEAVVAIAQRFGEKRIALSGGCFQNRYLTQRIVRRLREEKFQPYWHQRVPPNDGGIALGQIVAAIRQNAAGNNE